MICLAKETATARRHFNDWSTLPQTG